MLFDVPSHKLIHEASDGSTWRKSSEWYDEDRCGDASGYCQSTMLKEVVVAVEGAVAVMLPPVHYGAVVSIAVLSSDCHVEHHRWPRLSV